jgi:hypothetical protein
LSIKLDRSKAKLKGRDMQDYDWEHFDDWDSGGWEGYFEPPDMDEFFHQQALEAEKNQDFMMQMLDQEEKTYDLHYDDEGYYAYVLLNGDAKDKNDVINILEGNNIRCILSGQSYRPANNGKQYFWFIRIIDTSGKEARKPSQEKIYSLFDIWIYPDDYEFETPKELQTPEIDPLKTKLSTIEKDLTIERKRYETLNDKYHSLRNDTLSRILNLRKENNDLLHEVKDLSEQATKDEIDGEISEELRKNIAELNHKISKRDDEIDELTETWEASEKQIDQIKEQMIVVSNERDNAIYEKDEIIKRLEEFEVEKRRLKGQIDNSKKQSPNIELEFKNIVSCLLGNLHLTKGSISLLVNEVRDYSDALTKLQFLNSNPTMLKSKRIQAASIWQEIRFNTGEPGEVGRIYFAKSANSDDHKYNVLVSHKNMQKLDIRRLKKWKNN